MSEGHHRALKDFGRTIARPAHSPPPAGARRNRDAPYRDRRHASSSACGDGIYLDAFTAIVPTTLHLAPRLC